MLTYSILKIQLGILLLVTFSLPAFAEKLISYKNDVFPIFQEYCLDCHSPGGKGFEASGFDLRSYEGLMKGTHFGPVIRPGFSLTTTLTVVVSGHASPAIGMPYGIKSGLPKTTTEKLNKWVDQGAKNN